MTIINSSHYFKFDLLVKTTTTRIWLLTKIIIFKFDLLVKTTATRIWPLFKVRSVHFDPAHGEWEVLHINDNQYKYAYLTNERKMNHKNKDYYDNNLSTY